MLVEGPGAASVVAFTSNLGVEAGKEEGPARGLLLYDDDSVY
jgi:hypothetical protein